MQKYEHTEFASNATLLNRVYSIFTALFVLLLTVAAPFFFKKKIESAAFLAAMLILVLMTWSMSHRGQQKKAMTIFASSMWLLLVALLFLGSPQVTTSAVFAFGVILGLVVSFKAGMIFCGAYLLAWAAYLSMRSLGLLPEPFFPPNPASQWLISAISMLVVMLPIPEMLRNLRKGATLQQTIIESSNDGILVVSNGGVFETYNRRFAEIWGLSPEMFIPSNEKALRDCVFSQLVDPEEFRRRVLEIKQNPEASSFDTLRFMDGRLIERHSDPYKLDSKPIGRVWRFRDVTDRELRSLSTVPGELLL